jgi:hypothetical protein
MRSRSAKRLFACALTAAVQVACQQTPPAADTSPSVGVALELDRTSYSPGSQVQLRATNHTNDQLAYNPCTRSIERRQNDTWSLIVEADRVCTMQAYLLNAHQTRTDPTDLPSTLDRGTYRMALGFSRQVPGATGTIRAVSLPFQVE